MATLAEFRQRLDEYATKSVKRIIIGVQKNIATDVHRLLVKTNPVDTSLSRGGWFVTVGEPSTKVGTDLAGVSRTGAGVTATEKQRIKSVLATLDALPLGQTVWIANNIHYVKYLEAGTSSKAPNGIVGPTMATVRSKLRSGVYSKGPQDGPQGPTQPSVGLVGG